MPTSSYQNILINGKPFFIKFDYSPTPPTPLRMAYGIVYSLNPGRLVLSGFNERFGNIHIQVNSIIRNGEIYLSVLDTISQSENEIESPRVLRRLQYLRRWSHEQIKQVFP